MMRKSDFMKEWYYTTSDDIDKKYYFNSYADTVFEILYVYRYRAAKKDVPDYYVYRNDELVDTIFGKDLFKMYARKCGKIIEKSSSEIKEDIIDKELEENKVIERVEEAFDEINKKIEILTEIVDKISDML